MRIAAMTRPAKPLTEPAIAAVWLSVLDVGEAGALVDIDDESAPGGAEAGVDDRADPCEV